MAKKGEKVSDEQRERLLSMQHRFTKETASEAGRKGGLKSGETRRRKAAARKPKEQTFPIGMEKRIVLTGYDTKNDVKNAKRDLKAVLRVLSECTLYEIAEILSDYTITEQ